MNMAYTDCERYSENVLGEYGTMQYTYKYIVDYYGSNE